VRNDDREPRSVTTDLDQLLARGVDAGIISAEQRAQLASLAAGEAPASSTGQPTLRGPAPASALSVVAVAYALGALLVLFACGWFLVDRWARLGAWGVLAVSASYALILVAASRLLRQRGFVLASEISAALAVALTPLVAWPFLSLSGRWPEVPPLDARWSHPLLRDQVWMAWQWLILEFVLVLAALVTSRKRPMVTVTWPLAVALAMVGLHVSIAARSFGGSQTSEQWMILAAGFGILLVAERVERWQRRRSRIASRASDGGAEDAPAGDFANAFWVVGLVGSTVAFLAIWLRGNDSAWRHILLPLAIGLIVLSLYLRRRTVLLFGVLGVIGYLGFLAQHVFREYVSFPILLAGLGILVLLATVWTQSRFPALVERLEARRGSDERPFPWSSPMAALPLGIALALSTLGYSDSAEEREQEAFSQRLTILRQHSGSMRRAAPRRARPAPTGSTQDSASEAPIRNLPRDTS